MRQTVFDPNSTQTTTVKNGDQAYAVHNQWASRPDDQRFLTLEELESSVAARTATAKTVLSDSKTLTLHAFEDEKFKNGLVLATVEGPKFLTQWTFTQLCQAAHAPASYLKTLPAELVMANVNHGLIVSEREENMLLVDTESEELRAITSPTYGRIWDIDVIHAVQHVNDDGRWVVPASSYDHENPRRATTLYASDRDVFIFLCDPDHPLEVNGKQLFRGFYIWNSEVGKAVFGIATFLYNRVCSNRIIWGVEGFQEVRFKHTSGAPDRFLREGKPMLLEYANASAKQQEEKIIRAQNIKLGKSEEDVQKFLREKMGFTGALANNVIKTAKEEEGTFKTAWSLAQGITAQARGMAHTDSRVELERQAGILLDKVLK